MTSGLTKKSNKINESHLLFICSLSYYVNTDNIFYLNTFFINLNNLEQNILSAISTAINIHTLSVHKRVKFINL